MTEQQQPPPAPGTPERGIRTLDARTLRGLAHPLRIRLLGALRHDGPATASQLAERLSESSGATSYHLRQLASYGFVEDAPGHGKGRERWWRAAHEGTRFDEKLTSDPDPAVRGAADMFLHEIATVHAHELSTWLGDAHAWSREWRRASDMSDFTLRLTPERSYELILKMHELIASYQEPEAAGPADEPEGTESVRFHLHAFPRTTG